MNIHPLAPVQMNKASFHVLLGRTVRIFIFLIFLVSLLGKPSLSVRAATSITFTAEELLGKPENTSITVNIVPASTIEYHYQYGLTAGANTWSTSNVTATGGQPSEITITGLTANTQYFYRMQYHAPGDAMDDWVNRTEHSFWTQRAQGSTFTFTVTSDSHQNFNTAEQNAMTNIYNEHPDFEVDLGDTFLLDGSADQNAVNNKYLAYRKPAYFDKIGNSVPIFLASGNHEDEEGWNLDDTFSLALASIKARKLYYPTPINDGFYSGNTNILAAIDAGTYGDQYREDYYSWTWGDALFVVIDEFQYTMHNPYGATAGEGSDDPKTCEFSNDPNCQWNWTMGVQQYQWFKQTLENSPAKYKFIFSHNMLGGKLTVDGSSTPGYVRGGCQGAPYFEWGGKNADGTEGFADRRTATYGADAQPIRQLMMENGVSAYFHGHDHQYVYETCDGMVYQEVPSPGMTGGGFSDYTQGDHGTYNTVKILPNSGHLRITITPSLATVDYISSATSTNGTVNYSYTIAPSIVGPTHDLTTAVSPAASGTINPAAGEHSYTEGSVVPVTAIAASGYKFDHWSGDCTGSGACSVTMDADKSVTANFTLIKARDDYDGDGKTDAVKFDPATGIGWWLKSSTGLWDGMWLGSDTFIYVSASDFDGDGKTDPAKFYSGTGTVWWVKSTTGTLDGQWLGPDLFTYITGSDFDGDGKADPAKFYPATGTVWWVKSTTGILDGQWLGPDTFTYVSGSDFDGDGKADPAKFYPGTGTVWWVKSSTHSMDGKWLGPDTFTYVPASDFDGDGKTDPAKFYSDTGDVWWVKSSTGLMDGAWMGSGTFTYVPGCDFNGDGKTDPAKYDASTHILSWLNTNTSTWTDIDTQAGTYTLANGQ